MRSVWTLGRQCLRQSIPRVQPAQFGSKRGYRNKWRTYFRTPPRRRGLILAAAVGLSPAAFVQLSEKDNGGTEKTAESRMLEASREEIKKKVPEDAEGFRLFRHNVLLCLDLYIWEPLCTGFRFLHLVIIFVPVIVMIPVIWCGKRDPNRDNERSGCLWHYWFLVKAMERAGPAFIKVGRLVPHD
jgi:aarF domain-containing kinase